MQNILIVNGHEYHEIAKGGYNVALCETMESYLTKNGFHVKSTVVEQGYNPEEEVDKFLWADLVIFSVPKVLDGDSQCFKKIFGLWAYRRLWQTLCS